MHVVMVINKTNPQSSFVYAGGSRPRVREALAREIEEQAGLSITEAREALDRDYVFVDALVNKI